MFIKISTGKEVKPIEISKKQLIKELKEIIQENFNIDVSRQKLFFSGKLLDDDTPIYKYDLKDGYVVQVIESAAAAVETKPEKVRKEKKKKDDNEESLSEYYKLGEFVEVQDADGSWYDAEIAEIYHEANKENDDDNVEKEPVTVYKVTYKKDDLEIVKELKLDELRPRSIHAFDLKGLKIRQTFHVNYNISNQNSWGKWYDFYVEEIDRRKKVTAVGRLLLCNGQVKENVKLDTSIFQEAAFGIRKHVKISERGKDFDIGSKPIFCDKCKKNRTMKCKECGCSVCGSRSDPEKTIVCDECQWGFHIYCLKPALESVPEEDDWYCSECKNQDEVIKPGDKVKTKRGATADASKSKR